MAKSFRMNITIPEDLKQQMDAIEDPVNWSSIAAKAFQSKVAEHISKRGANTMQDTIIRLRASKQKSGYETCKAAQQAGREWAKSTAEATELTKLASLHEDEYEWNRMFSDDEAMADSLGERLYFAFTTDPYGTDAESAKDFWDVNLGFDPKAKGVSSADAMMGFAIGALEVWKKVKDHI